VDGGKCAVGLESTILDLTVAVPKILRPGAVTADEIAAVLGEEVEEYRPAVTANPKAPGQLKQHYCTHTRLVLFDHGCRKIPGLTATTAIVFNAKSTAVGEILHGLPVPSANVFWLSEAGDHATIGSNLFATLRHLDRSNFSAIFCERPERHGLGVAIDDRLLRAAAKFSP
jgi:L-threonylcarbamoyladenylate synthase